MIPGLTYIENWITTDEETFLVEKIDASQWQLSLKRRVQQYGPVYDYSTRRLIKPYAEMPDWIVNLFPKLLPHFSAEPDQVIINEYTCGQGITRHIDSPLFGLTVASISLLSSTPMLVGQYNGDEAYFPLERRSIVIMKDDMRNKWFHCIPRVAERRISITFRTTL